LPASAGNLDEIRQLTEKECRLTPQRGAILQALLEMEDRHPTAEEVYQVARRNWPSLGLATVYRALDMFAGLGVLYRLDAGDGRIRYEINDGPHQHLICLGCGRIFEIREPLELEGLLKSKYSDFEVTYSSIRFFGYCQDCRLKKQR